MRCDAVRRCGRRCEKGGAGSGSDDDTKWRPVGLLLGHEPLTVKSRKTRARILKGDSDPPERLRPPREGPWRGRRGKIRGMPSSLRGLRRWAAALLAALLPVASVLAATPPPLGELEGHYEYREGATLFMVADGDRLVAILGDGKYPLRATGVDTFMNGGGETIPFIRDGAGRIVAFKEKGDTFKRLSPNVPDTVRSRLRPRPPGSDGKPPAYRYKPPADHADGIRVGAAGPGTLSRDAAERLVAGVIDGAYPDVRSILVYQAGALRLEEYFYGYDRNQPHQMRSFTKSVIALLAGAAVHRGKLRADEPVLGRLGYAAYANPDPRKDRITLLDLLSNRSGLACNDYDPASPGNEEQLYETDDWVKAFVDLPMTADPGAEALVLHGWILRRRPRHRAGGRQAVAGVRGGGSLRPSRAAADRVEVERQPRPLGAQRVRPGPPAAPGHVEARTSHPATGGVVGPAHPPRLVGRGRRGPADAGA